MNTQQDDNPGDPPPPGAEYVHVALAKLRALPYRDRFDAANALVAYLSTAHATQGAQLVRGEALIDWIAVEHQGRHGGAAVVADELRVSRQQLDRWKAPAEKATRHEGLSARALTAMTVAQRDTYLEKMRPDREQRLQRGKELAGHPDTWPALIEGAIETAREFLSATEGASVGGDWQETQLMLAATIGQLRHAEDVLGGRIPPEDVAEGVLLMAENDDKDPTQ